MDESAREKIRKIILMGLDDALERHTEHMFAIRLRSPGIEHPREAVTGMRNGIKAYVNARRATLEWNPPSC